MTCGVYSIRNRRSGKMYIGSSTDIERRWCAHRNALLRGDHDNPRLSGAYAKAGSVDVFEFGLLEECGEAILHKREQHWVDTLRPNYNIRVHDVRSNKSVVPTEEARAKMAAARTAYLTRPGVREKIAAQTKARWNDQAERAKLIAGNKAAWTTERREVARTHGNGVGTRHLLAGQKRRWLDPDARERQSAALQAARAKKQRTYQDIEALIVAANPQWSIQSLTGTKTTDQVTIHCAKHDATHSVRINMLVSRQQGCRLCGWERSSVKNAEAYTSGRRRTSRTRNTELP